MPDKILNKMLPLWREAFYEKGATIIHQNTRARLLLVLLKGTVALSLRRGEGELVIEMVKKKGALFGWSALVPPKKYTATAKALEDTRVLTIAGRDIENFLKSHPTWGLLFYQRLSSLIAIRLYHLRSLLAETIS